MKHTRRTHHASLDRRIKKRRKKSHSHSEKEKRSASERRDSAHRRAIHDRRRHVRFPIITDCVKPVEFKVFPSENKEMLPGILTQLSSGGMALVSFTPVKVGTSLFLSIDLPHFKINMIEGKVVRVEQKGESYLVGIHFNHISPDDRVLLNRMGFDFSDCELKLSFGISDVCFKNCAFYPLCEKPQKQKTFSH